MDNVWSIFTEHIGGDGLSFAYDLDRIARCLRLYHRSVNHWQRLFPDRILELHYEKVVAEPELASRQLAAFLELEWELAMLDFHKNEREVRTASLQQVRQPIYTSSINRWQLFQEHLQPLSEELRDLIAAYESTAMARRGADVS